MKPNKEQQKKIDQSLLEYHCLGCEYTVTCYPDQHEMFEQAHNEQCTAGGTLTMTPESEEIVDQILERS